MKKFLCVILALTLFVGAYFTLPKSISSLSGKDIFSVSAGEIRSYRSYKSMTLYYYTSSGSKKSFKITSGKPFIVSNKKYIEIRQQEGSSVKIYKINVEKYIKNGTFY